MRRGISILLALLVGIGPLLWPLQGRDDQHLPACCRRNGAHHCAMAAHTAASLASGGKTAVTAPLTCPSFPRGNAALLQPASVLATALAPRAVFGSTGRIALPADPAGLSGPRRTHAGRGPPAPLLS